jgi:N-methylhydantoinase B
MGKTMIDPVTLAVFKGRLEQVADVMDVTLCRSAFNPIIAEAHDASHGIYDGKTGETLVQGKDGLPLFVAVMSFAVKAVIEKAAKEGGPKEGDIWIFNDPYVSGTHLNDFRLMQPLFRDGKVFCYLASAGHWLDIGGNVPGNYNPVATETFQEGVLIPLVKLCSEGELRQDIVDIVMSNTRLAKSAYGDLNGQLNALKLGAERMHALLDEYGDDQSREALNMLKKSAADIMRSEISKLPDGKVSAEDWLDNDGITDEPLKVALDLTVQGDKLTFDFSRSSPAAMGPINTSQPSTISACYVALKHLFKDVPANSGVLEPIEFVIDEDSLLAVKAPRPVGGYTETSMRLIDVIFQAISKISPETSYGCAYGTINALSLSGRRENNDPWVMFCFFGGGHGGHSTGDGLNHGNAPFSTATMPPVEILEASYPIKFTNWGLRPDSGGDGEYRGGLGAVYGIEMRDSGANLFLFSERGRFAPQGFVGGGEAAMNEFTYSKDGEMVEPPLKSKLHGVKLSEGDRILLKSPGGGGYGDPAKRSKQAHARDLELGYITED